MDANIPKRGPEDRNGGRYAIHVKKSNKNLDAELKMMDQQRQRQGTVLAKVDEAGEGQEKKPFGGLMMFGSKGKNLENKVQKIKSGLRNLI